MEEPIAIVGAGVSGLTCGVVLAEHGYDVAIFANETGQRTTSAVAAAIWFPYDAEPSEKVVPWALQTFDVLCDLARFPETGVSMIELGQFSRNSKIQVPDWAIPLGVHPSPPSVVPSGIEGSLEKFRSCFSLRVPLVDTTIYLDYLATRFRKAGGEIHVNVRFEKLDDLDREFGRVINCAGIGARALVQDASLEPHRGQVAIVPKIEGLSCAIVCDDAPLMYVIPRTNDCVFGGTNDVSDSLAADSETTSRIVAECSRVLNIEKPPVLAARVGLRPFRKSGVRLERDQLTDCRTVIHNYGHGGSGFTLSWGCAQEVFGLTLSG